LEEIDGDLLEADFWAIAPLGCPARVISSSLRTTSKFSAVLGE
jgi:hypothetical protein